MAAQERRLKSFMYDRLYHHPRQQETARKAADVVSRLYAAYDQEPRSMGAEWGQAVPREEPERSRHISDYIAGMTDRFALDQCRAIYGQAPVDLSNV